VKKVAIFLLTAVTAVFALSVAAGPAVAKKGKARALHGLVQSVGSDSITLKLKKGATVTVQVNGDTKIVVNNKAATLADIQIGYRALVKGKPGQPAKAIRANALPASGTVVRGAVEGVGSNSITIKQRDGSSVTVAVNSDTKIRVNGKPGALSDIETGYRAVVVRTAVGGPAKAISAHEEHGHRAVVKGIVDGVGANSITIKQRNGASATIAVTADTKIRVKGHHGAAALTDIQVGFRAIVLRAGGNGPALAIHAHPPKS
jgi:Domain of unknown function (DUF5666)